MNFTEKVIESNDMYRGDFLRVERVKVELPNKKESYRDIVRHPGAVALLAFLDNETILLVEQFRIAVNKTLFEIPAGKLENGEDPYLAAQRELEEETGFKAGKLEYLGYILTGPGFTDEKIHIYKATELYKGIKGGDDDEFIEVSAFEISDVKKLIKERHIIDAKTISALMYL